MNNGNNLIKKDLQSGDIKFKELKKKNNQKKIFLSNYYFIRKILQLRKNDFSQETY